MTNVADIPTHVKSWNQLKIIHVYLDYYQGYQVTQGSDVKCKCREIFMNWIFFHEQVLFVKALTKITQLWHMSVHSLLNNWTCGWSLFLGYKMDLSCMHFGLFFVKSTKN